VKAPFRFAGAGPLNLLFFHFGKNIPAGGTAPGTGAKKQAWRGTRLIFC